MSLTLPILTDFISSLALLGMMAMAYGFLRRRMPGDPVAQSLLGLIPGGITILQMNMPLVLNSGVIVDMRCVPVALAGAFLGWRGLASCLFLAFGARIGIGGTGMLAGLTAMAVAGIAGLVWANRTDASQRRSVLSFLALAAAMSLHLVSALLLPPEVARQFLVEVAPVLLTLNVASVTAIAWLLERERVTLRRESIRRRQPAPVDPAGVGGALAAASRRGAFANGSIAVSIRLRQRWLKALIRGGDAEALSVARLQRRIARALPSETIMGMVGHDQMVVVLPDAPDRDPKAVVQLIRGLGRRPLSVGGAVGLGLSLRIVGARFRHVPTLEQIADVLDRPGTATEVPPDQAGTHPPQEGSAALFAVAERLLDDDGQAGARPPGAP